jgi:glycosyltransferase involved in cell wall biosynthesis
MNVPTAPPLPISAVMLARDASETLARSLDSLADCAEVLVYDNGSTDGTQDLARRYANVRVIEGHFDGFGPTRNRAAALARHDWILNIDSDEWPRCAAPRSTMPRSSTPSCVVT